MEDLGLLIDGTQETFAHFEGPSSLHQIKVSDGPEETISHKGDIEADVSLDVFQSLNDAYTAVQGVLCSTPFECPTRTSGMLRAL